MGEHFSICCSVVIKDIYSNVSCVGSDFLFGRDMLMQKDALVTGNTNVGLTKVDFKIYVYGCNHVCV